MIKDGKLDKYGKPNEQTPKQYLASFTDYTPTSVAVQTKETKVEMVEVIREEPKKERKRTVIKTKRKRRTKKKGSERRRILGRGRSKEKVIQKGKSQVAGLVLKFNKDSPCNYLRDSKLTACTAWLQNNRTLVHFKVHFIAIERVSL